MSSQLSQGLLENYRSTLELVADVISQFDDTQWLKGESQLQVPWKLSYHIVDCLDYYFRDEPENDYEWGYRFGGGWWELVEEDAPSKKAMLQYLEGVEERIITHLATLENQDLQKPFDREKEHGETRLAHYIYGLRHTMHHHGSLSLLSLQFGNEEGIWV